MTYLDIFNIYLHTNMPNDVYNALKQYNIQKGYCPDIDDFVIYNLTGFTKEQLDVEYNKYRKMYLLNHKLFKMKQDFIDKN